MPLTFDPLTVRLYHAERGAIRMTGTRIGLDILIYWYKRDPRPEAILEVVS